MRSLAAFVAKKNNHREREKNGDWYKKSVSIRDFFCDHLWDKICEDQRLFLRKSAGNTDTVLNLKTLELFVIKNPFATLRVLCGKKKTLL